MIAERTVQLAEFYCKHFDRTQVSTTPSSGSGSHRMTDGEVFRHVHAAANSEKFSRLWAGDTNDYGGDDSAADLALLSILAFWTQDTSQLDRLFRRSALYREKWERADYRTRTLARALDFGARRESGDHEDHEEVVRAQPIAQDTWPSLKDAALYGLAGDIVKAIEPETEGDPAAVLVNFLTMFGSAVGREPHASVGAAPHNANLFALIVGQTSRGRKGTAHSEAERIVRLADEDWGRRIAGGLSSGEGLIQEVRDPVYTTEKEKEVLLDPGVTDKRLLVVEQEFSSVLRRAGREGNTLSEVLRQAWDGRDLRSMTRKNPLLATDVHISILGHITMEELLRELDATDRANGFANRFLFMCVKRSKMLPHGGQLAESHLSHLVREVERSLAAARTLGHIRRDAETNRMWEGVYPRLTRERPGMLGAVLARAEAQALRLSLLYALIDGSAAIRRPHLEAALAVWQYAEDSSAYIFGDSLGDPLADRALAALRATGPMTQSALNDLFRHHAPASKLGAAMERLVAYGKVHMRREETLGRPATLWIAV